MRPAKAIVIFLVMFHASGAYMATSGFAEAAGVDIRPSGGDAVEAANQTAAEEMDPESGIADNLFGMFTSLGGTLESIFAVLFAGPLMLMSVGVPGEAMTFLYSVATILVAFDLYYALTGRSEF